MRFTAIDFLEARQDTLVVKNVLRFELHLLLIECIAQKEKKWC
jgi:hypothetical protein